MINDFRTFTYDTETTGLNPLKSFIISIAGNLVSISTSSTSDGKLTKEFLQKCGDKRLEFYQIINWKEINPNFTIPEETIKVHHITDEIMVRDGLHPVKVFSNLYDFMDPDGIGFMKDGDNFIPVEIINAFNLSYDVNMMRSNLQFLVNWMKKEYEENGSRPGIIDSINLTKIEKLLQWFTKDPDAKINSNNVNDILFIDSMTLDKILNFEVDGVKVRHNLDAVGKRCGFPEDPDAHNALADTRRLTNIWLVQLFDMQEKGLLPITDIFEARLVSKYNRDQTKWKKSGKDQLDYFGFNMKAASM